MAITRYAGNRMTGTNTDRTGLSTTNLLAATTFLETDTDDLYQWTGSAWNLISGNSVSETLTNKTMSGSANTFSNIANSSLVNSSLTVGDSVIALGGTDTTLTGLTDIDLTSGNKTIFDGVGANTLTLGAATSTVAIAGDLTVSGTTTTVNSTTVTIDDPIFTVGGDTAPSSDDNKDRGIMFRWYSGAAKVGFFGHDDSLGRWTYIPDGSITSEVASGTKGDIDIGDIYSVNGTFTGTGDFTGILTTNTKMVVDQANANFTPALDGQLIHVDAITLTDNSTAASGTAAQDYSSITLDQPTVAATNTSVTTTNAYTLYVANAPTAGTNMTLTNAYALYVAGGATRFAGSLTVDGASTLTGAITASDNLTVTGVLTVQKGTLLDMTNANFTPSVDGHTLHLDAVTLTDNSTAASGTAAQDFKMLTVDQPTVAATNTSVTTTNAYSFYVADAPTAGTNMTLTNAYALFVAAGAVQFDGTLTVGGLTNLKGSVDLGDATGDTVTVTGRFDSSLVPSADNTNDLGTATLEWKDIYIDGTANLDAIASGSNITAPNIITSINDSNGNELITVTATSSAVNEINITNAATGDAPIIKASGETNVGLQISGKGTGGIILTNSTANGAFLEFDTKATPANPADESARMYLKQVDAANNAMAVKIQKAGAIQEVEITSPHAICEVCGSRDGAKDPTFDFQNSVMIVSLWCGHEYEIPMENWRRL